MADSTISGGKSHFVCRRLLAVVTVLCALGGVVYVTGIGRQIHQAISNLIVPQQEAPLKRRSPPMAPPSEPLEFKTAAVSADYKKCSEYGAEILRDKNGNAVDAAIATALCVGVVNAHSAGIGGGGFMIIYDKKSGKTRAINFRETVAALEKAETMRDIQHLMFEWKEREIKTRNPGEGEFIGVPGELRGFEMAWKKFGRLPWKDLFQPAIEIATNGFPATPAILAAIEKNAPNVTNDPGLRELFKPNGQFIKDGDLIKRTKYGKTLTKIAEGGADVFYRGKMAQQIVKDLRSAGSKISLKDLKNYKASELKALETDMPGVKGYKFLTVPPPAGGVALIDILNILKGYNFGPDDMKKHPARTYHRMIEAFNFVAARETYLTDPAFDNKVDEVVRQMLDPEEGERLRQKIDDKTHPYDYYGPINYHIDVTDGTTHFFGAKMRSLELGIIYNDQLWDAVNLYVNEYNLQTDSLRPRKRPMSLASPSIILDGEGNVRMVIGAAGGKYIATALSQVLMNYFWFGDSLKDAVSKPRLHSQLFPSIVLVEPNFPEKYIKGLKRYGHKRITNDTALFTGTPLQIMGVVQLVVRKDDGELLALADYRKGGVAAGYR
ncbi:Gamma-glutamyltranspeptidase 1 [Stylophora pistillata]|uniref:Gamma-glutamyltranspeptidase 1 n=1 Tax=Stylophora pistillata TaxID=50429 RepID=A0A2B4RW54_STYPI|nr:Gamma-glutamyltranspeptidase 1 [Stylophora pistillata]